MKQFVWRQVIVKVRMLGEIAHALVHGGVIQFFAQDASRAGSGKNQTEENLEGGCLPRPIRAQQAKDFAQLHLEGQGI